MYKKLDYNAFFFHKSFSAVDAATKADFRKMF